MASKSGRSHRGARSSVLWKLWLVDRQHGVEFAGIVHIHRDIQHRIGEVIQRGSRLQVQDVGIDFE